MRFRNVRLQAPLTSNCHLLSLQQNNKLGLMVTNGYKQRIASRIAKTLSDYMQMRAFIVP